ncbi:uncharacterized protein LOC112494248 [Cephus cinctus]|uniref:Uncharacterized protein LOC112494248 n=1 Tax=Cephus cinctus TaxID=211228 RepID=A0AAJ7RFR2_CEPCN|nr:uncharacterized protein LOC112494248 [Cephus cinctus]
MYSLIQFQVIQCKATSLQDSETFAFQDLHRSRDSQKHMRILRSTSDHAGPVYWQDGGISVQTVFTTDSTSLDEGQAPMWVLENVGRAMCCNRASFLCVCRIIILLIYVTNQFINKTLWMTSFHLR